MQELTHAMLATVSGAGATPAAAESNTSLFDDPTLKIITAMYYGAWGGGILGAMTGSTDLKKSMILGGVFSGLLAIAGEQQASEQAGN